MTPKEIDALVRELRVADEREAADLIEALLAERDAYKAKWATSHSQAMENGARVAVRDRTIEALQSRLAGAEKALEMANVQQLPCTCAFTYNTFDGKQMSVQQCPRCSRLAALAQTAATVDKGSDHD